MSILILSLLLQSSLLLPPRTAMENPAGVSQVPQKLRKDYDKLWVRFVSAKQDSKLMLDLEKFLQKNKTLDSAATIQGYLSLYGGDDTAAREKFMRAYAEAMHYFLTNMEGTAQIVAKYTKVEDHEVNAYAIESESHAVERTLQVDPKGIELILGLISKSVPQAASAKAQDFYDPRFFTELRDSGFLKKLWGEK